MLDNAREGVESAADSDAAPTTPPGERSSSTSALTELPSPDPSTYEGANRIVNLWVGADGETDQVDVWGRRTFTTGPVLLAENVAFGQASDYFSAPPEHQLVVVSAGAGPDGAERATMFNATMGEQITAVFTNGDDRGAVSAVNLFEHGTDTALPTPTDDTGAVVLIAPNVRAFSDGLVAAIGGDGFYVGDGAGGCRRQRVEAEGLPAAVLGGKQRVEIELSPGSTAISLHPWPSADECGQPSVLDITVAVEAGRTMLVVVYSLDGSSITALTLPVDAFSG